MESDYRNPLTFKTVAFRLTFSKDEIAGRLQWAAGVVRTPTSSSPLAISRAMLSGARPAARCLKGGQPPLDVHASWSIDARVPPQDGQIPGR